MAQHGDTLVWTLHKGTDHQAAEVRTSAASFELRRSRDGEWYFGRRHDTRTHARQEADLVRRGPERNGWNPRQVCAFVIRSAREWVSHDGIVFLALSLLCFAVYRRWRSRRCTCLSRVAGVAVGADPRAADR